MWKEGSGLPFFLLMKYYLGIDLATDNAGYAILNENLAVTFSRTFTPKNEFRDSEIMKCVYQRKVLFKALELQDFTTICVEAPAFGFSNRMVSIGMIHGALLPHLIETGKPIVYTPPTKWKYAMLGNGHAEKKVGVDFVLNNFKFAKGLDLSHFDNNQADAIMFAYFAYIFDCYTHNREPFIFDTLEKRIEEVFLSEKIASRKKSGIIHRPNEFYFNS